MLQTEGHMYFTTLNSPFGQLTLSSSGTALTGLWFAGQKGFPSSLPGHYQPEHPIFRQTSSWLDAYFSGMPLPLAPPLDPQGTAFQKAVWQILLKIPYGKTTTYGTIAAQMRAKGLTASAQAVGGAVGRNPISLLIPCHRVIGSSGTLTGYAAGVEIKEKLLLHEKSHCNVIPLYMR